MSQSDGNKPETMLAIEISSPGGPDALHPVSRPMPVPQKGEVLIRVHAAGVNRPDVMQRRGLYPAPQGASDLPGLEVSGEIAALGEGAERWSIGDQVVALTPGGGYATHVCVPAGHALPLPKGFSFIEGAALPETFFTVWSNVFERGRLQKGESLLIHGGTSGIGTTAIQLAKAFGATVIVTAGSADKCAACEKLGADLAINYREADFVDAVHAFTDGKGVNLILDMVGGDYVERNYDAASEDGRIVQIATMNGAKSQVNFAKLMVKRLTHTGSTLRPRSVEFKAAIAQALEQNVWPLLESRKVSPLIDKVFPLRRASKAHEWLEAGNHIGKIILEID